MVIINLVRKGDKKILYNTGPRSRGVGVFVKQLLMKFLQLEQYPLVCFQWYYY